MDVEPGLRRRPRTDPATVGDEPALVDRLRDEIVRDGPISFERFMRIALYDPEHGYYTGPVDRPTRAGDFLTAPELHPVFGRLVGRQLEEVWQRLGRPVPFVVREHGAGAGTLGLSIVEGLRAEGAGLAEVLRYEPIERNHHRLEELRARWTRAGLADRLVASDDRVVGAIIANELLDALPVYRVRMVGEALRELFVTWDADRLVEVPGPPSTPALAARLLADGVSLRDGQTAEICLAIDPWVAAAAASLERGVLLIIDYGHPAETLYGPRRHNGTLRAYLGHRVHADPFRHIGRQDLTAHVDLTAIDHAATAAGLERLGWTSQAEFLVGLGIGELLGAAGAVELTAGGEALAAYIDVRAAVARLLDPQALGGFAVMAFGRGIAPTPPLTGFAWRLPSRSGT
jgi:SAM-dependent MidA family methyltransferase